MNRTKFTIKAETCFDGLSCQTKVRIYSQAIGQYAVEMQRRSGDCIAFQRLYNSAARYLNSVPNFAETGDAVAPVLEPTEPDNASSEVSVAPLLDLAESGNMQLQAEAAQGLLQATEDMNLLVQLYTPHALVVFRNLLQLVCFSIAEPLARLLHYLAMSPEAKDRFADQDLLQTMIERVWAPATGRQASVKLAQATHHAITQHCGKLSWITHSDLTFALMEKLRIEAPVFAREHYSAHDASTVRYLEESLHMLRNFSPLQDALACC